MSGARNVQLKIFEGFFPGLPPIDKILKFLPGFWKVYIVSTERQPALQVYFQEIYIVKFVSKRPYIIQWKRRGKPPVILVTKDCELVDFGLRDELDINLITGKRVDTKYVLLVIDSILGRYRLRLDLDSYDET